MGALTTAGPDHRLPVGEIPGRAGAIVRALGARAAVHTFEDAAGARIHAELLDGDVFEVREVLRVVLDAPGPVLDLAAGAGHLTMPLLALRREVSAADISPHRLARLRRRLVAAPQCLRNRCSTVQVDPDGFSLGARFAAIVLGSSSVTTLDGPGRAHLFECVRQHLGPNGRFVVSTVDHGALALPVEVESEVTTPAGKVYRVHEYWEPGESSWYLTAYPARWAAASLPVCAARRHVVNAAELQVELERAGLPVVSRAVVPMIGPRHRTVLIEAGRSEDRAVHFPFVA